MVLVVYGAVNDDAQTTLSGIGVGVLAVPPMVWLIVKEPGKDG